MSYLVGVDPGETSGISMFNSGRLVSAEYTSRDKFFSVAKFGLELYLAPRVVIEEPQWRKTDIRSNPNDLIKLAILVGEIKRFYEEQGCKVELVTPLVWKGSVPKDIHNKWTLEALAPEELRCVPKRPRAKDYDHNCLDAIGLGLWKLGRLRVR